MTRRNEQSFAEFLAHKIKKEGLKPTSNVLPEWRMALPRLITPAPSKSLQV